MRPYRFTASRSSIRMPAALVLVLTVLAGCGDSDRPPGEPGGDGGSSDTAWIDTTGSLESDDPGAAPRAAANPVLTGQGLQLLPGAGTNGGSRTLGFGTPRDSALEVLGGVLGEPRETGEVPDCAAAYATWEGITAWFARGRFAGWHVRDRGPATGDGVGIGSTRAELERAGEVKVRETSLGTEFTLDGVAGLLESGESAAEPGREGAVVTHLWAGHTCIAR